MDERNVNLKAHTLRRPYLLTAIICGFVLLAGCSDDKETITVDPDLVLVVDEADGSPVAGIKVVVMDPRSNLPVAGPVVSGTDGICNFGTLPEGDHRLLVFGGVGYQVHAQVDMYFRTSGPADTSVQPLLSPVGVARIPPARVVETLVRKVAPDSLPRIAGQVVDAGSGDPLSRVFVSLSPYLTGYQGATSASDDITGQDGHFSVSQIIFAKDPYTGNLIQVSPLRITRQGYRPVIWSYYPPHGSDNVDICGVTITMTPVDDDDNGSISGRLMRDGLPAAGVAVGLGVVDLPVMEKAGAGLPGWAAVTDQDGRYIIGGLPAGTYILRPGFPLNDGAFFPDQPGNVPQEVGQSQAIDAGDLNVLHEIEPLFPSHGLALVAPPTTLHWTEVPGTTSYEVRFNRGILPPTDTNSIELPESLVITPGLHYWYVLAAKGTGQLIGASQVQAVFRLLEPPD